MSFKWVMLLACSGAAGVLAKQPHKDDIYVVMEGYKFAQEVVQARWDSSWSEDMYTAEPKIRGFVHKTATMSQNPTIARLPTDTARQFREQHIPIHNRFQVWGSRKWKFIYIRQPKSSSTAIMFAIRGQLCGLSKEQLESGGDCEPEEFEELFDVSDEEWNSFFVFTVVRNPWARMYSAYAMFRDTFLRERAGEDGEEPGKRCSNTFEEFSEDSYSLRELCDTRSCCSWLGELSSQDFFAPNFVNIHINDQSHGVFLPGGESLVEYIGATETLDEDWGVIVSEINKRAGTAFEAKSVVVQNPHKGKQKERPEEFNERTLRNIAHQYAMDVLRYGYL